jgi:hypothetical protein
VRPAARDFSYDALAETTIAVLRAWGPAKRGATLHLTFLIVYSMPACELATVEIIAGDSAALHALSRYGSAVLDWRRRTTRSCQTCFNQLKRKENAWSAQKINYLSMVIVGHVVSNAVQRR